MIENVYKFYLRLKAMLYWQTYQPLLRLYDRYFSPPIDYATFPPVPNGLEEKYWSFHLSKIPEYTTARDRPMIRRIWLDFHEIQNNTSGCKSIIEKIKGEYYSQNPNELTTETIPEHWPEADKLLVRFGLEEARRRTQEKKEILEYKAGHGNDVKFKFE